MCAGAHTRSYAPFFISTGLQSHFRHKSASGTVHKNTIKWDESKRKTITIYISNCILCAKRMESCAHKHLWFMFVVRIKVKNQRHQGTSYSVFLFLVRSFVRSFFGFCFVSPSHSHNMGYIISFGLLKYPSTMRFYAENPFIQISIFYSVIT